MMLVVDGVDNDGDDNHDNDDSVTEQMNILSSSILALISSSIFNIFTAIFLILW